MYQRPLMRDGTRPPETVEGQGFRLRVLRLTDAEKDYAAVMDAADRLRAAAPPGELDGWPEGLTLHDNRIDLGWHEKEFECGHSFAWTVVAPDDGVVLGCAYLYPSHRAGYDAMAFWWVRALAAEMDRPVGATFRAMLAQLPLPRIAFPGRDIDWSEWQALPDAFG